MKKQLATILFAVGSILSSGLGWADYSRLTPYPVLSWDGWNGDPNRSFPTISTSMTSGSSPAIRSGLVKPSTLGDPSLAQHYGRIFFNPDWRGYPAFVNPFSPNFTNNSSSQCAYEEQQNNSNRPKCLSQDTSINLSNFFIDQPYDYSLQLLSGIFGGNIAGISVVPENSVGTSGLSYLFGVINAVVLTFGVCIAAYTLFVATINTAQEGEFLGKKYGGSLWLPLRMVLGLGLLVPINQGFNAAQGLAFWFIKQGIYAADVLWTEALTLNAQGGLGAAELITPAALKSQYKDLPSQGGCYGLLESIQRTVYDTNSNFYAYIPEVLGVSFSPNSNSGGKFSGVDSLDGVGGWYFTAYIQHGGQTRVTITRAAFYDLESRISGAQIGASFEAGLFRNYFCGKQSFGLSSNDYAADTISNRYQTAQKNTLIALINSYIQEQNNAPTTSEDFWHRLSDGFRLSQDGLLGDVDDLTKLAQHGYLSEYFSYGSCAATGQHPNTDTNSSLPGSTSCIVTETAPTELFQDKLAAAGISTDSINPIKNNLFFKWQSDGDRIATQLRNALVQAKADAYVKAFVLFKDNLGPAIWNYYFGGVNNTLDPNGRTNSPFPIIDNAGNPTVENNESYAKDFYSKFGGDVNILFQRFYDLLMTNLQTINENYGSYLNAQPDNYTLSGANAQAAASGWISAGSMYFSLNTSGSSLFGMSVLNGDSYAAGSSLNDAVRANSNSSQPLDPHAGIVFTNNMSNYACYWCSDNQQYILMDINFRNKGPYNQGCAHDSFRQNTSIGDPQTACLAVINAAFSTSALSAANMPANHDVGLGGDIPGAGPAKDSLGDFASLTQMLIKDMFGGQGDDPLQNLATFGGRLQTAAEATWLVLTVALGIANLVTSIMGLGFGTAQGISGIIMFLGPALMGVFASLWTLGLTCKYLIPLVPYATFTASTLGWFFLVIEAILGAPMIALSLMMPSQDELGKATTGLSLLTSIFFRPALMTLGFILAKFVLQQIFEYLRATIGTAMSPILSGGAPFGQMVGPLVAFVGLAFVLINKTFSLIHYLPDRFMKWAGLQDATSGIGEEGMVGQAQQKSQEMGQQASTGFAATTGAQAAAGKGIQDFKTGKAQDQEKKDDKAATAKYRQDKLNKMGGGGNSGGTGGGKK